MLRIVDRDFVELSNLQRQTLFDEADAAAALPKAIAAAEKLRKINSTVTIEPIVADIGPTNIERLLRRRRRDPGWDRQLRDAVSHQRCGGEVRLALGLWRLRRGRRAVDDDPARRNRLPPLPDARVPRPGSTATCESAGILGPIVGVIASIEAAEAIKILSGNRAAISRRCRSSIFGRTSFGRSTSPGSATKSIVPPASTANSPGFPAARCSRTAVLCGRNAVQLSTPTRHLARRIGRKARRRGRTHPQRVPLAAEGRRLRANDLSRRPRHHLRHGRLGNCAGSVRKICWDMSIVPTATTADHRECERETTAAARGAGRGEREGHRRHSHALRNPLCSGVQRHRLLHREA